MLMTMRLLLVHVGCIQDESEMSPVSNSHLFLSVRILKKRFISLSRSGVWKKLDKIMKNASIDAFEKTDTGLDTKQ